MWIILLESIITGIVFTIISNIIFSCSLNKKNDKNNIPYSISVAFFMSGVIIYIFCELDYISAFLTNLV